DSRGSRLHEYWLADAAIRAAVFSPPADIPHVAIVGPTQTGKSTIVNAIVRKDVVEASPMAGATIRPHAICASAAPIPASAIKTWLEFPAGAVPHAADEPVPSHDFGITHVGPIPLLPDRTAPDVVLWDTPDFDSIGAAAYEREVMRVAGAAAAHIFVLSREKYADLTVWNLLRRLCFLNRPAVLIVNKMTPEAEQPILAAMRDRLSALHPAPTQWEIRTLPQQTGDVLQVREALTSAASDLREWLATTAEAGRTPQAATRQKRGAVAFLRGRWSSWIEPLEREYSVAAEWAAVVDERLTALVQQYQEEYLNDPKRYDSFRRATIELLALLELPGVSRPLARVREIITYPIRAVLGAGREAWQRSRTGHGPRTGLSNEQAWLHDALEELFVRLRREAARRADAHDAPVWSALSRRLEDRAASLGRTFEQALAEHCERSNTEIQNTAQELYETLQKNPAALQGLRAARATADVAGIALAIKTGGAPMHDLLLAPALLALTSLLTEGALSGYMRSVASRLKERLLADVRQNLVDAVLREQFLAFAENLAGKGVYGIRKQTLKAAEAALDRWEKNC
ncbi:MAG: GTPase domain-containing protein, partial [Phycisphaerae bacterium]